MLLHTFDYFRLSQLLWIYSDSTPWIHSTVVRAWTRTPSSDQLVKFLRHRHLVEILSCSSLLFQGLEDIDNGARSSLEHRARGARSNESPSLSAPRQRSMVWLYLQSYYIPCSLSYTVLSYFLELIVIPWCLHKASVSSCRRLLLQ